MRVQNRSIFAHLKNKESIFKLKVNLYKSMSLGRRRRNKSNRFKNSWNFIGSVEKKLWRRRENSSIRLESKKSCLNNEKLMKNCGDRKFLIRLMVSWNNKKKDLLDIVVVYYYILIYMCTESSLHILLDPKEKD